MPTNGMTIDSLNTVSSLTAQDEVPVWDKEASGEPTRKITAQNMANSVKSLASLPNTTEMNTAIDQSTADVIRTDDVVNNLTSTSANQPLSANMGKTLEKHIQQSTVTLQGDIDALNSKFGKRFMSEIKDFKSLANGQSVTCTINLTESIEIGLVIYNIAHCGNGKKAGGYWDVSGLQSPGSRTIISIPCPSTWDSSVTAVDILVNIGEGTRTLKFTNNTGVSTDKMYISSVFATVIKLK